MRVVLPDGKKGIVSNCHFFLDFFLGALGLAQEQVVGEEAVGQDWVGLEMEGFELGGSHR